MRKQLVWFVSVIVVLLFVVLAVLFLVIVGEDAWVCENGVWVKQGSTIVPMPSGGCLPENDDALEIPVYFR